ncbi:ASCH domain-containing protein [Bacillus marinisedimentorum]|uniref:ASCH domain-containing protein n=1 Tax=Bacillus marinisedimentorum TaxID=1821260 RepID=UPI000B2E74D5|nr:ASCH domain-containing protein [Bacillus marinisedimentorum]
MKLLVYTGIYLIITFLFICIGRSSLGNGFLPIFLAVHSAFLIGALHYKKEHIDMKGLMVKAPWIDLILEGKKTWEIRGSNTHQRGKIGLIKSGSGLVFGTVDIVRCEELSLTDYKQGTVFHCIDRKDCLQLPYKRTFAWVLDNPFMFETPVPYKHPMGAVIWVDLEKALK